MERQIASVWDAYAEAHDRGDAAGVARWVTDDAVVLAPGLPDVRGREGFRRLLAEAFTDADFRDLRIESRELRIHGDRAYQIADFSETMVVDGKDPRRLRGRLMVQWIREGDGWRIHRYISNSAPAP